MTSSWVVAGGHKLKFDQWMNLDLEYVKRKSVWYDLNVFISTILMLGKIFLVKSKDKHEKI